MKILFICTHNRCRSILSEAITRKIGDGLLDVRSAGSHPVGEVHPLSLKYLAETGYSTTGLSSQSWDEFEAFAADLVITVCDSAAGETCPAWFGSSVKAHWALADPSKLQGSEAQIHDAFLHCIELIEARARQLVIIAEQATSADQFRTALKAIGAQC